MLRVYSQSLGCPKNLVDTEHVLGSLGPVLMVTDPEEADLIFINTCAFIGSAVEESVHSIVQMVADMEGCDGVIAVAGCLVGRFGISELSREIPEVGLWLHTDTLDTWGEQAAQALRERGFDIPQTQPGRLLSTGPSFAWLKIGEGCRHNCAFCTIPSIRGAYRSTQADILEAEARAVLKQGVKEIVLVAQDVTAWGSDLDDPRKDLRPLLERLLPLNGLERLRFMYLYPAGLTDDLLKFLANAGSPFVPYFDVPLQHASPDVLSRMGRPFAQNPQLVVDRIRKYFPDAALRTSMMVGFPGETEEQFQQLMDFVEETRFHQMGVFAYEAEEGTVAASMPDQIPQNIKDERRNALMELQSDISTEILSSYEGSRQSILVDSPNPEWPGLYVGRTWFQAPEVDGVTYVSGPNVVAGAMVEADIVETHEYDLVALA